MEKFVKISFLLQVFTVPSVLNEGINGAKLTLPSYEKFEASIDITNHITNDVVSITEQIFGDEATVTINNFKMSDHSVNRICSYSRATGFGHIVRGIVCESGVNLPQACFCSDESLKFIVPISNVLRMLRGSTFKNLTTHNIGDYKTFYQLKYEDEQGIEIEAFFIKNQHSDLQPLSLKVKSTKDESLNSPFHQCDNLSGSLELQYTVQHYRSLDSPEDSAAMRRTSGFSPAPAGIFCPRPDLYKKKIPELPDQFSVKIETIDQTDFSVTFSEQNFDMKHQIVTLKFAPRSHNPPSTFFSRFLFRQANYLDNLHQGKTFTVIHDFSSGLQYTLDLSSSNCTVDLIPMTPASWWKSSHNTEILPSAHVKLKHAKELLDIDPAELVYSGEREFRGVTADVWIGEKTSTQGYHTTEIFFSRHLWNFYIEELNIIQEVPLGIKTYFAQTSNEEHPNSTSFSHVIESNYFDFNPSSLHWQDIGISSCVSKENKLYLKISFDVKYEDLLNLNRRITRNSLEKVIARWASVSPLRIVDIYFSASSTSDHSLTSKDGMDIWFVLLGKPEACIRSRNARHKPQCEHSDMKITGLKAAYSNLARAIANKSNVNFNVKIGIDRQMVARVRSNSLEMSSEKSHPLSSLKNNFVRPYFFLRASYTAGAMAGLGFSMAILGVCVGIFLGFLLWKRRIGLPPNYLSMANAFPRISSGSSRPTSLLSASSTEQNLSFEDVLPQPNTPPPRY